MKIEEFIKNTDYQLLLKQKQSLLELTDPDDNWFKNPDLIDHIDGLLNFLDGLQDAIVESKILPEEIVFPLPKEQD
jgi:hypothetical protein